MKKPPKHGMRYSSARKASVTIDLLACVREINAGTFCAADRITFEKMLPGLYQRIVDGEFRMGDATASLAKRQR